MRFILYDQEALNGEDGCVCFCCDLGAAQDTIDQFVKDGLDEKYVNELKIAEVKSIREVHLSKQGIIGKPQSPTKE